jgi:hypothetical protein
MGKNKEDNDSQKFLKEGEKAFKDAERVFVDLLDFENFKNEEGK